jgi:hypothetical protein
VNVIHFTYGATDRLTAFGSKDVYFVARADGNGESHVGCAHLDPGATGRPSACQFRDYPGTQPSLSCRDRRSDVALRTVNV